MIIRKMSLLILASLLWSLLLSGCSQAAPGSAENQAAAAETTVSPEKAAESEIQPAETQSQKHVAKDGADMQTDDKSMPTRKLPENGTRINMHFGDTVIPGVLNDSETAQALIGMLPVTVHMNRYSHDFCGSAKELDLPYQDEEVHYGWLNGDIDYAIDAPWFTILFEDEDVSEQYGYQVNIGVIDCPLETIRSLDGSYDVLVELAEDEKTAAETTKEETDMSKTNQIRMQVGSSEFTVTLAETESAEALKTLLADGPRTISCSNYGGFEKVCSLGERLPSNDTQTTTKAGDVMLYNSNQIVIFYDSNSWAYTRLGRVDEEYIDQLSTILSGSETEITLSLVR